MVARLVVLLRWVCLWAAKLAFVPDRRKEQNHTLKWWKRPAIWSLCLGFLVAQQFAFANPTPGFGCYSCVPWPSAGPGCWHCGDPDKIACSSGQPCQDRYGEDASGCLSIDCICALNGGTTCGDYSCALGCSNCEGGAIYQVGGVVVAGACTGDCYPAFTGPGVNGPSCCSCPDENPCSLAGGDADDDGCCDNVDLDNTNPLVCNCSTEGGDADGDGCCANQDCDDTWGYGVPGLNCSCPCDIYGEDTDGDGCCAEFDCDNNDPSKCDNCDCEDGDEDGCCVEDDCDDADPEVCATCNCDDKGGDADEDGCCADDDCNDNNPASFCKSDCESAGGDADCDGCCEDSDSDDNDPEADGGCQNPCGEGVPDEDDDGCCDDKDPDPEDPEIGCCQDDGGDEDEDGCCADFDEDDEDPEKGCECKCEAEIVNRYEDFKRKLKSWAFEPTGGDQWEGLSGLEIPIPGGDPVTLRLGFDLSSNFWPEGVDVSWLPDLARAWCLLFLSIRFALAIKDVLITW